MTATYVDSEGRTYVTTLSKSEWEAERAAADKVHVVRSERTGGGDE